MDVASLQLIQAVEDLAPDAMAVRGGIVWLIALEPLLQAAYLPDGPGQVAAQTQRQRPGVLAGDQADQQTAGQQQEQTTHQGALPILVHCLRSWAARAACRRALPGFFRCLLGAIFYP